MNQRRLHLLFRNLKHSLRKFYLIAESTMRKDDVCVTHTNSAKTMMQIIKFFCRGSVSKEMRRKTHN